MSSSRPLGVAGSVVFVAVACSPSAQGPAPRSGQQPPGAVTESRAPAPQETEQRDSMIDCASATARPADGAVLGESYPRWIMERWLKEDAQLRQSYGQSEVKDCAGAARLAALHGQRPPNPAESEAPPFAPRPAPIPELWIDCSGVPGGPSDLPEGKQERYYPVAMKEMLEAVPTLEQRYGQPEVKDCTDARRFMAIYAEEEARIFRDHGILPPPPPSRDPVLHCSGEPGRPADLPPFEQEKYSPALLKAWLDSDPALRQSYGQSEVKDCAGARRFMALFDQDRQRLTRENATPDRRLAPPRYVPEGPDRTLDCTPVPGKVRHPGAETYLLNVIENLLASDAQLRMRFGKREVRNCIDARRFVGIARQEELRMHEEEMKRYAPPAPPTVLPEGQAPRPQ